MSREGDPMIQRELSVARPQRGQSGEVIRIDSMSRGQRAKRQAEGASDRGRRGQREVPHRELDWNDRAHFPEERNLDLAPVDAWRRVFRDEDLHPDGSAFAWCDVERERVAG